MNNGPKIAITGMSMRLAGASDLDTFWHCLTSGRDPFMPLPCSRFDPEIFGTELPSPRAGAIWGALVDDFSLDWRKLRLPPAQVERFHRVERLSLAAMGDALTDAKIPGESKPFERGGIWLGASTIGEDPWLDPIARIRRTELVTPFQRTLEARIPERAGELGVLLDRVSDLAAPPLEPDVLMISACVIAGRASQIYNFRGGHLAIDAGLCSSLAAVSKAVRALQQGDVDIALVCAAAPLVTPATILSLAHAGNLGNARPAPFAPNAAGTLLGDGAVALVLERLEEVGRRRSYATIEAVSCSVAPGSSSAEALAHCVEQAATRAMAEANAVPDRVGMIESRACGIAVADRAEAAGLAAAYGRRSAGSPILLTSSVPVVGFLQAAAGLVAMVKSSLALHRRSWPGQANLATVLEPASGLRVQGHPETLHGMSWAAVSDAGPSAIAYHALLSAPVECSSASRVFVRPERGEPIAIVGAGVVAPKANSLEAFWLNVLARRETFGDLPPSRWDATTLIGKSPELARAFRTRLASTVNLESLVMPAHSQPRQGHGNPADTATILAISAVGQALSDARYAQDSMKERTHLVCGQIALRAEELALEKRVRYALLHTLVRETLLEAGLGERDTAAILADARSRFEEGNPGFSATACEATTGMSLATRVASACGISGDVLSLDAACASSLAALKIATDALHSNSADVAVACGISFHLFPEYYIGLGLLDALSSRAGSPFHRDADGFVPAEAAGAVVLKRLSDARRAGDRIYAVVAGHGIASDGHGLSIYSANPLGQQRAMTRALDAAGWAPGTVDLLEAHSPGAPVGDRAEMVSTAATYGERPFHVPLSVASNKSLIGHSTSAGAMLSLIRAAMAIDTKTLPASGGDGDLVPELPFGRHIEYSRVSRRWVKPSGQKRRASVNSFGMTGIDHHVLLEEADTHLGEVVKPSQVRTQPATRPGHPLQADRFVIGESEVTLPERSSLFPLRGRNIGLVDDCGTLWQAVERTLMAHGANVHHFRHAEGPADEAIRQALESLREPLDGIIDLSSFRQDWSSVPASPSELWSQLKAYSGRTFALLRSLYGRLYVSQERAACYVAITSTLAPAPTGHSGHRAALGAFFQGIARALRLELPSLVCKAIDVDAAMPLEQAAHAIVAELEDGNERVDIRLGKGRLITTFDRECFRDETAVLRELTPGNVFLFSGGGRGVVYECAVALARLGMSVVVTGRRPLPDGTQSWLELSDLAFLEFRRAELLRRKGSHGPARVLRELDDMEFQRQVHGNIKKAQDAGLGLHYETCDVTDASSVHALADRVRQRFGRIDGIGHGAMVEHSALLPHKTPAGIESTMSTKVLGLMNLVEATRRDPLKWFVAFGSGIGRIGNSGQTDYAAANATMANLLKAYARSELANTHCVTIDWPAWEALGATADPDIAGLLRAAGVTSISVNEGCYWFLSELSLGSAAEVMICGETMLRSWPGLGSDADGSGERSVRVDDCGRVLTPRDFPMLDCVRQRAVDSVTVERELSVERDHFLAQHKLNGIPVVPAAFCCELLAEAALLCSPGYHLQQINRLVVASPVSLPRNRPLTARVVATCRSTKGQSTRTFETAVKTSPPTKLAHLESERHHVGAQVILTLAPPESLGTLEYPNRSERVHSISFYETLTDSVELDRLFFNAHWIQVFEDEVLGIIEPPDLSATFDHVSQPRLAVYPLVMDSALQIAGSWDGYRNGLVSVPIGIDTITFGRPLSSIERCRVIARVLRIEHPDVYYDISIANENSELVLRLSGVHLKRIVKARDQYG